jgi:hypothetical protein
MDCKDDILRGAAVTENEMVGYTVAYDQDEIQFPVYVLTVIAAALLAAAAHNQSLILLSLGFLAACGTLYNYPLIETGRPRLGAGQYGVFLEGLGLLEWRAIDRIEIVPDVVRGVALEELEIGLKTPVDRALIIDWRKRPLWRLAMRLPWKMPNSQLVKITLGVLDRPGAEIQSTLARMWRYHRGATGSIIELSADDDQPAGDDGQSTT